MEENRYEEIKNTVHNFKKQIFDLYKEHLELLASLPDNMPADPEEIAAAVALSFDNEPQAEEEIKNPLELAMSDDEVDIEEMPIEEAAEKLIETVTGNSGFVINSDEF